MMNYDKEIAKDSSTIELYRIYFENWGKVNQTGTLWNIDQIYECPCDGDGRILDLNIFLRNCKETDSDIAETYLRRCETSRSSPP